LFLLIAHSTEGCSEGPTLSEVLADGSFQVEELPSDEAWFGTPDPAIYTAGTNNLDKQQLAEEVAKGNVVTLRQLKQHLAQASDEELKVRAPAGPPPPPRAHHVPIMHHGVKQLQPGWHTNPASSSSSNSNITTQAAISPF
jgi:hypothetical protein